MTEFLTTDTQLPPYLIFPRFLLDSDLSETTKLLYMVLLDRARLSMKNEGWTDKQGHVFIYFTITDMADVLHKGEMTIKNSLTSLENADLIFRKRRGAGLPNQIYVKIPPDIFSQTDKKLSIGQTENCPADRQKIVCRTDKKLSGNKNKKIITNSVKEESNAASSAYGKYQNVFLTDEELEDLKQSVPDWSAYIEKLSSYMTSTGKSYQNHAATIKNWAMKDKAVAQQRNYECKEYESL